MKKFLKWFIVIATIITITVVYFTIAQAEEPSHQSQLKKEALEIWKYIQEQKKENFKKNALCLQSEREKILRRQEEKELNNLLRVKEALELTKYFVDSGGIQEKENLLVVGYNYHKGELAPVWADFSQDLSKLKSFER